VTLNRTQGHINPNLAGTFPLPPDAARMAGGGTRGGSGRCLARRHSFAADLFAGIAATLGGAAVALAGLAITYAGVGMTAIEVGHLPW
jgi:hypothetical protein